MGTIWHGHALGNNSTNRFLEKEKTITTLEFNAITAENCMKPSFIQPKEGVFTFAQSDEMMAFSEANDLLVVGHTLVWKNSTPKWFFEDEKGNEVSREVLLERLKTHVQTVARRAVVLNPERLRGCRRHKCGSVPSELDRVNPTFPHGDAAERDCHHCSSFEVAGQA